MPEHQSGTLVSVERERAEANELMKSGFAVAALGVLGAAVGSACPLCVVVAPTLVGAGAWRRWRLGKRLEDAKEQ